MANETFTAQVAGLIEEVQAEAIFKFNQHAGILTAVNWVDIENEQAKAVDFPIYNAVTSSDVAETAEGTDVSTNKQITNTATTITVVENVIMSTLSDLSVMSANRNLVGDISSMFADGMLAKLENDVVTLFAGFDTTTVSGMDGSIALGLDQWFAAIAGLKAAGANVRDLVAVLSPLQYWGANGLRGALSDTGASVAGTNMLSEEFLAAGFVDVVAGVPVLISNEITETTTASGAMFEKSRAIGLVTKGLINIEIERDASLRGFQMVGTGRFNAAELTDTFGVELDSLL